jgi:hypothetical protein
LAGAHVNHYVTDGEVAVAELRPLVGDASGAMRQAARVIIR